MERQVYFLINHDPNLILEGFSSKRIMLFIYAFCSVNILEGVIQFWCILNAVCVTFNTSVTWCSFVVDTNLCFKANRLHKYISYSHNICFVILVQYAAYREKKMFQTES